MLTILSFVAIVCLGFLLRVLGVVRREDAKALNAVIVYTGLPALVFRAVHGASPTSQALGVVAFAWGCFAVLFVVSSVAARLLKLPEKQAGSFVLAASLGNTGFIGYPMAENILGAAAVPFAVFYDVFGTVLQLVGVGIPTARRYGGATKAGFFEGARELLAFPALLAAVVALAMRAVPVPVLVGDWLEVLAKMVAPLVMLSAGISLKPATVADSLGPLAVLAVLRLLAGPVLVLLAGRLFGMSGTEYSTVLLQVGMPSMMLTLAVGERLGLDGDFIASAVFVTTVASVVTIPLMQFVAQVAVC
ncbi:MAG: AEC family transporter [Coriobacteriia bacterium]|nr:AEC family transporter [Coriobacteriia bacterium]